VLKAVLPGLETPERSVKAGGACAAWLALPLGSVPLRGFAYVRNGGGLGHKVIHAVGEEQFAVPVA